MPEDPAIIDTEIFEEVFDHIAPARRVALLAMLVRDLEGLGGALVSALELDDQPMIATSAHGLKGVAGGFGADALLDAIARRSPTQLRAIVDATIARAQALFEARGYGDQ